MNHHIIDHSLLALVFAIMCVSGEVIADSKSEIMNSITSSAKKIEDGISNGIDKTTNYSNDTMVTANVKSAFVNNKLVSADKISVSTKDGIVELTGSVANEEAKKNAVTIASGVEGVKDVKDNLTVSENSSNEGNYLSDTMITSKVKAALLSTDNTPFSDISVKTEGGIVYLTGKVNSKEQSLQAERVAKSVKHVKEVKNQLVVE